MAEILTPEQELKKLIEEKKDRVAKEIQEILDKEGMTITIGQVIQIVPKQ